ncbi:hypothetical protein L208DRAFT_607908 [Tricholoma matsutake]|nr:hypothetical protein L208DRAFT_607908 [Tricholoma matsutake 945]
MYCFLSHPHQILFCLIQKMGVLMKMLLTVPHVLVKLSYQKPNVGEEPCNETGLWIVRPDFYRHKPCLAVVHLDCMLRGAHLIGVAGDDFLPQEGFDFSPSLDSFKAFYVNKYIDYHAHEIL